MQQVGPVGGRWQHGVISLTFSTHRSRCQVGNDLCGGENGNRTVDGEAVAFVQVRGGRGLECGQGGLGQAKCTPVSQGH